MSWLCSALYLIDEGLIYSTEIFCSFIVELLDIHSSRRTYSSIVSFYKYSKGFFISPKLYSSLYSNTITVVLNFCKLLCLLKLLNFDSIVVDFLSFNKDWNEFGANFDNND